MRILIIEDDTEIAANLYDFLETRGHSVDIANDGNTGYHLATTKTFDGILLDLGLPNMNGLELCDKLREEAHVETPVLMLTARDTLEDKLSGFRAGADDYLVKPFALKEVEARLLALHKRSVRKTARPTINMNTLRVGELELDPKTWSIHFVGNPIQLPRKCVRLLEMLMQEPGRVYRREELELQVWGKAQANSDTLRSHMHALRRALLQAGGRDPIETVHGVGYRLSNK